MPRLRTVGLGLTWIFISAGASLAQIPGGINFVDLFVKLDSNGDQVIDKEEIPESGRKAFDRILKWGDTNKNGQLDAAEYRTLLQSLRQEAQELGQGLTTRFQTLDKDGDGKISREEFPGPEPMFQRLDGNKDGFVTRKEATRLQAIAGGLGGAARFQALDKDGDGKVSRDEFPGPEPVFQRLDGDKDGFLTREELTRNAGGLGKAAGKAGPRPAARLQALDKDGDGKISREEFDGPPQRFDRLDADSDGYVTLAELRAGMLQGAPGKAARKKQAAEKDVKPDSDSEKPKTPEATTKAKDAKAD